MFRHKRRDGLTATAASNCRGQIHERIELLHLTGSGDREEPGDGELARRAAIAEHDLAPLCRRPGYADLWRPAGDTGGDRADEVGIITAS